MRLSLVSFPRAMLFIMAMNQWLIAASGCTVLRDHTDEVRFDTNKLGYCPATDDFCLKLNARPSTWSGQGPDCGCKCSTDHATFLEGENTCAKNDRVHYGCQIYSKRSKESDSLPVLGSSRTDTEIELSLTTKGFTCTLDESITTFRNASTWISFPPKPLPFDVIRRTARRRKRRGKKKKKKVKNKLKKKKKSKYSVKLLHTPDYLQGRLVKLGLSCESHDTHCFVFKVEGQQTSNLCASLVPIKSSTVFMETSSSSTNGDTGIIGVTSAVTTASAASRQKLRHIVIQTTPPLTASVTTAVIVTTDTLLSLTTRVTRTLVVVPTKTLSLSKTRTTPNINSLSTTSTPTPRTKTVMLVVTQTPRLSTSKAAFSLPATKTLSQMQTQPPFSSAESKNIQTSVSSKLPVDALGKDKTIPPFDTISSTNSSSNIARPTDINASPTKERVLIEKRQRLKENNMWPIVGGVIGAVVFIALVAVAFGCFIKKRRKSKPRGDGGQGYQMQNVGILNEAYSSRTDTLYSEIEDKNISYQALFDQNKVKNPYQQLSSSIDRKQQASKRIYSSPETNEKGSFTKGSSTECDYATLEAEGEDSGDKGEVVHSKRDSEYCKIKKSYVPGPDNSKVIPSGVYDYAVGEGHGRRNKEQVLKMLKQGEEHTTYSKDSSHYYKVLEVPNPESANCCPVAPDIPEYSVVQSNPKSSLIKPTPKHVPNMGKKLSNNNKKYPAGTYPDYATLQKGSVESHQPEIVEETDSEGYLVPRDGNKNL